ncbi:hypothetical protein [Natranaeroarchaeum sulfidigenes]|uniref:Cell surface protein n=1 Tax=Natranaeroarchaeum sulfidigenes TaxID=2784880 RepID=A0A897MYZ3_9EURY|nr:hypothetical protein [Natranaeroarchaeum sulfidigenes]QSG04099.1 Cell surface protein [Natranaeroarchaeum sulfidigenes]
MTDAGDARRFTRRRLLWTASAFTTGVAITGPGSGADDDDTGEHGAIRWSETYDRPGQYVECNAIATAEDGYYLAGETGYRSGTSHGWVHRVDESGGVNWEFIDNRPGDEAPLHEISAAPGGGCVAVGDVTTHLTDESNVTAVSLGQEGEFGWAAEFGRHWHVSISTLSSTEDGYVIGAYARSYATQGTRILLLSIDSEGTQRWIRTLGEENAINVCRAVLPVDDGYLVAGSTDREDDSRILLVRTDEQGRHQWDTTYDVEGAYSLAHAIIPTEDGGYLLGGRTGSSTHIFRAVVIKVDATGDEQWRWVNTVESACHDLVTRPSGGCVLAGRRLEDGWLAALNGNGELIGSESYRGNGESTLESLVSTDEGYVAGGRTAEFDSNDTRAWLLSVSPIAEPGADPIEPEYSVSEQEDDSLPGFSSGAAVLGLSAGYVLSRRFRGGQADRSRRSTGREE